MYRLQLFTKYFKALTELQRHNDIFNIYSIFYYTLIFMFIRRKIDIRLMKHMPVLIHETKKFLFDIRDNWPQIKAFSYFFRGKNPQIPTKLDKGLHLLIANTIFWQRSEYLRIAAASQLVSENLTSIVAASGFVD